MKSFWLLVVLVALASVRVNAEPPKFSFSDAKIPNGWTVVDTTGMSEDCGLGSPLAPISLRNEDGTIWISGAGLSESDQAKTAAMFEEKWVLEKTGEISGTEFVVFAPKPDRPGSHMVWFPTLGTYFSIGYSIHGYKNFVEFGKWYTPPDAKTRKASVSKAMKAIESMMSQIILTLPKPLNQ